MFVKAVLVCLHWQMNGVCVWVCLCVGSGHSWRLIVTVPQTLWREWKTCDDSQKKHYLGHLLLLRNWAGVNQANVTFFPTVTYHVVLSMMVTLKCALHKAGRQLWENSKSYWKAIDTIIDIMYQKQCGGSSIFRCPWKQFLFKPQSDVIRGWFSSQCQHTTAPPSFATSAWSRPLQHKHNILETSPTARIISPCNTTQLLSSDSPSASLSLSPPRSSCQSGRPADRCPGWTPTASWRQISLKDLGEPCFPFPAEIVA